MSYKKTIHVQGADTTMISADILIEFNVGLSFTEIQHGKGACIHKSEDVFHRIVVHHKEQEIIIETFIHIKELPELLKEVERQTIKFLTGKVNFVLDPYIKGCVHTLGYE